MLRPTDNAPYQMTDTVKTEDVLPISDSFHRMLSPIRESYAGLICWKVFRVARHEKAILDNGARPNDRVGKLQPILSP